MNNLNDEPTTNNLTNDETSIDIYAEMSDFELDLSIVKTYINDSIDNIEDYQDRIKVQELLIKYGKALTDAEKALPIIQILVIMTTNMSLRFYNHQEKLKKQLKKAVSDVKRAVGETNKEYILLYDLKGILG